MSADHWRPALQSLTDEPVDIYGPESFRDYLRTNEYTPSAFRTAAEISIDTRRDLPDILQEHDTMVLRLGSAPEGTGTQFTLVRVEDRLDEFFIDEAAYDAGDRTKYNFIPGGEQTAQLEPSAQDILAAYRMLPQFSETSLVSLALSTGVISDALDLDVDRIGTAPTTISSTSAFEYLPHTAQTEIVYHNNGQVEVDALALTQRDGKRVLFVIEAKSGRKRALAKHKLFYPLLATRTIADDSVSTVIPVYLRAKTTDTHLLYDLYECSAGLTTGAVPCLSELQVRDHTGFRLQLTE